MARYHAYTYSNNVGDGNAPLWTGSGQWDVDTYFLYYGAPFNPPPNDFWVLFDSEPGVPVSVLSYTFWSGDFSQKWAEWDADGNFYSFATLQTMLFGFPAASTQDINSFFFSMNDKIWCSDFGDDVSGWWGNDKIFLGNGQDYCYYAAGMGKDTFKNFDWKNDMVWFDTDLGPTVNSAVSKIKFKDGKTPKKDKAVLKIDKFNKVVLKGKDAPDSLGQLSQCTDVSDWYV